MAYGMRVKDASGNVKLDTTHRISRFRYSNLVAAGASSNTTLADISGLSSIEISVMVNMTAWAYVAHAFTRSGTTVMWTAYSAGYFASNQSLVFLFLYT